MFQGLVDAVIKHRRALVILKLHKRDEDVNKRERNAAEQKKKRKTAKWILGGGRERRVESGWGLGWVLAVGGGGRSAPFPPKKRRVKRWTLYK